MRVGIWWINVMRPWILVHVFVELWVMYISGGTGIGG